MEARRRAAVADASKCNTREQAWKCALGKRTVVVAVALLNSQGGNLTFKCTAHRKPGVPLFRERIISACNANFRDIAARYMRRAPRNPLAMKDCIFFIAFLSKRLYI